MARIRHRSVARWSHRPRTPAGRRVAGSWRAGRAAARCRCGRRPGRHRRRPSRVGGLVPGSGAAATGPPGRPAGRRPARTARRRGGGSRRAAHSGTCRAAQGEKMASAWPRSLTASPVTGNLSWANDPARVKSQVKTSSPNGTHPIGLATGSQAPSVSAGQGPVLWAWLDLNQRPHPNQRSTAERRANQPFRWSGDSVVLQDGVNRSPGCTSASWQDLRPVDQPDVNSNEL